MNTIVATIILFIILTGLIITAITFVYFNGIREENKTISLMLSLSLILDFVVISFVVAKDIKEGMPDVIHNILMLVNIIVFVGIILTKSLLIIFNERKEKLTQ